MPTAYDISFYRGDTYSIAFQVWEDIEKTMPHDLTGVMVKSEIRNRPSGSTVVPFSLTVDLPNRIDAFLDAGSSSKVPYPAVWDLQLSYPTGVVKTIVAGNVTITFDVTDSLAASR